MADNDSVDPRIALGVEPISAESPGGEDVKYEPEYEALTEEVGKMDLDGPTAVDWQKAVEMSSDLLRLKTKDFKVAGYYAYGLARLEGLAGLTVGLKVISGLIENFWDTGFPPPRRERARVGAVDWLAEKTGPTIAEITVDEKNAEDVLTALDAVDAVDRLLEEKAEKTQANLSDLLRPLRERKQDAEFIKQQQAEKEAAAAAAPPPEPEPEAPAAPAAPTPAAATPAPPKQAAETSALAAPAAPAATGPAPAASAAVEAPRASGPELDRAVSATRSNILAFARGVRAADIGDPRAYTLSRAATWLAVNGAPPVQNGETMLPPPQNDVVTTIETMVGAENHTGLIEQCENVAATSLFWLDPHRHVANALGALGHSQAQAAVVAQVSAFLQRFPSLPGLKFQGGRPFADDQTRMWITDAVLPSGGGSGGGGGGNAEIEEAYGNARGLAATGKLDQGVALLTEGRNSAAGGRDRFLWDLAKARLAVDAGLDEAAHGLLSGLGRQAEAADLEAWEPDLSEQVTRMLLQTIRKDGVRQSLDEDSVKATEAALAARLYRLNMSAALEIMRNQP